MNRLAAVLIVLLASVTLAAATLPLVQKSSKTKGRVDLNADNISAAALVRSLSLFLDKPVSTDFEDRNITLHRRDLTPNDALEAIAKTARLRVSVEDHVFVLRDPNELRMSLDVKDAELPELIAAFKKQCGIRNIIVDPGVTAKGTFLFRDVPCGVAFRTVFSTLGLGAEMEPNSVMIVGGRN